MDFTATNNSSSAQQSGAAIVGVYAGRRLCESASQLDKASGGALTKYLKASTMNGDVGQAIHLHGLDQLAIDQVILVGLGRRGKLDATGARKVLRKAASEAAQSGARSATSYLAEAEVADCAPAWIAAETVLAFREQTYRFDQMKGSSKGSPPVHLKKVAVAQAGATRKAIQGGLATGDAIAGGMALSQDLGNLPGNVCTPSYLADRARQLAKRHAKMSVNVKGEAEMKRLGMGSLLSVARGSREPPRLITMQYNGGAKSAKPIVLIGKGVTFDSGGISIKPSGSMDEMKFDMCGAASVLGALQVVCDLALPINVIGIIAASENMPDGAANKPGDIVTSMAGITIEILNTDAEGRLLLCDAITYAERFKPDVVIDMATLTGACVVALGSQASGLFSNHDALAQELIAAGDAAGDRAWRMPVWDSYQDQLQSNFADVANVGGRDAGAVTAACFLERFARDQRWAHLDIAGTAWRSGKSKGATGRPVPLLSHYLLARAKRTLG